MRTISDPAVARLLQTVSLYAYTPSKKGLSVPSYGQSQIGPDGSFRLRFSVAKRELELAAFLPAERPDVGTRIPTS